MGPRIAISQSNYIPWKGYFDLIGSVDTFVILDTVQYTKNDWRNRNRILTKNGPVWLTIPMLTGGKSKQLIYEAQIDNKINWQKKHWAGLKQSYSKSPFFSLYEEELNSFYESNRWEYLSDLNVSLIKYISKQLKLKTEFIDSRDLDINLDVEDGDRKTDRVIEICKSLNGSYYLTGPSAKSYLQDNKFKDAGVELDFIDYSEYPKYEQIIDGFEHSVSILDLLFMKGEESNYYIFGERLQEPKKVGNF